MEDFEAQQPRLAGSFVLVEHHDLVLQTEIDRIEKELVKVTQEVYREMFANSDALTEAFGEKKSEAIAANPNLAPAFVGKAFELAVKERIKERPLLKANLIYQPQQEATQGRPDFAHVKAPMACWEITTKAAVVPHIQRPGYGATARLITYERPPNMTLLVREALRRNEIVIDAPAAARLYRALQNTPARDPMLTLKQMPRAPPRWVQVVKPEYERAEARYIETEKALRAAQTARQDTRDLAKQLERQRTETNALLAELARARVAERKAQVIPDNAAGDIVRVTRDQLEQTAERLEALNAQMQALREKAALEQQAQRQAELRSTQEQAQKLAEEQAVLQEDLRTTLAVYNTANRDIDQARQSEAVPEPPSLERQRSIEASKDLDKQIEQQKLQAQRDHEQSDTGTVQRDQINRQTTDNDPAQQQLAAEIAQRQAELQQLVQQQQEAAQRALQANVTHDPGRDMNRGMGSL